MFVTEGRSNYDAVLEDLLPRIDGTKSRVRLFGAEVVVKDDGLYADGTRLDTTASIIAVRYLLEGGSAPVQGRWIPYRDLKDGARFAAYVQTKIEDPVARAFDGKRDLLEARLRRLGAGPGDNAIQADLAMVLEPLPHVPLLALFQDRDDEFPASFRFLFDASASAYLDLESLAVLLEYVCLKITGEA